MYDIIIIGAGPSGMYAGYLAATQKLTFKILEATDTFGGQIKLYQDKPIYDMASYTSILGKDFIGNLKDQLYHQVDDAVAYHEEVVSITGDYPLFTIHTKTMQYTSKFVILASGGGLLAPKTLEIKDEASYTNLSYAVADAKRYEGKHLAILGGGDTAVDWAHYFISKGSHVSLIHRRDTFRAQEHLLTDIYEKGHVYTSYEFVSFTGFPAIQSLSIQHAKTETVQTIPVDHVFVFYGSKPTSSLRELALIPYEKGYQVSTFMETSKKGMYAIGNMAGYPGKVSMIVTGLGEAATAISAITNTLNPKKKLSYGSMTS